MDPEIEAALDALNGDVIGRLGKLEKGLEGFDQVKAAMLEIEKKAGRPNLGGGAHNGERSAEVKAFANYVRTGSDVELKALNIGTGGDGGYAVPKEIDATIDALALKMSPIRQLATVVQTSTSDYHRLVNKRGWGATWVGETTARPSTTTATLADIQPPMGELYAFPLVTQHMIDDAYFNVDQWLLGELAAAFVEAESSAFVSGDGIVKPRGFMTATFVATGDATRDFGSVEYIPTGASAAFAANSVDVFLTALSKMKAGYLSPTECAWVMNQGTFATVLAVKDLYGRSLVMPSFAAGGPPTLLGFPIVIAEHMPDVAANSYSIVFANWKRFYLIADRIGTTVLRDSLTQKPYVGFYSRKRTSGIILNSEAGKAIKFAAS